MEQAVRSLAAEMLFDARVTLGVLGEVALTIIRALLPGPGMPDVDDIIDIPFREEGLYLVRGLATPQPGDSPRHTRATSVVGTFVEVRDLAALARSAMPTATAQRDAFQAEADRIQAEIATAQRLLADPATRRTGPSGCVASSPPARSAPHTCGRAPPRPVTREPRYGWSGTRPPANWLSWSSG